MFSFVSSLNTSTPYYILIFINEARQQNISTFLPIRQNFPLRGPILRCRQAIARQSQEKKRALRGPAEPTRSRHPGNQPTATTESSGAQEQH